MPTSTSHSPVSSLEQSFVSAVLYLHDDEETIVPYLDRLERQFSRRFAHYEYVIVDDCSSDGGARLASDWGSRHVVPTTIVTMSREQGLEAAMNAGISCSIGDWIYEFDVLEPSWPEELVLEAFNTAVTTGIDVVSVCPSEQSTSSKAFYHVFNDHSRSNYELRTDAFRLASRRAINRVRAVSDIQAYRKAAFAALGMSMRDIVYDGAISQSRSGRASLAVESLILYTDVAWKWSLRISFAMLALAIVECLYAVAIRVIDHPIEGWFTTIMILTLGFCGLFTLMAVIVKYLSLILEHLMSNHIDLIEGVKRVQREEGSRTK